VLDNDNGIAVLVVAADPIPTDPEEATDDSIPTEPPDGLGYRLSPSDDLLELSIPSEPPDGLLLGTLADSRVSSSSADDLLLDDHHADDSIPTETPDGLGYRLSPSDDLLERSIPSEPPDGLLLGTRLSFSTDDQVQPRRESSRLDSRLSSPSEPIVDCRVPDFFGFNIFNDDHGINAITDDASISASESSDRLISFNLLSASDNISTFHGKRYRDNSWGAVHNGRHKAMISVPIFERNIVDHRPVMIDRRMIRGAITTTGMRPIGTPMTYQEMRIADMRDWICVIGDS
jgi:hypothetical protein